MADMDRMQKRKLETYARTLLEAAKTEDRVYENISPLKAEADASPEVLSVLSAMAAAGRRHRDDRSAARCRAAHAYHAEMRT